MKRRKRDLEEDLEGDSLDTVPTEGRTVIARLCEAFVASGQSVQDFRLLCEDAGYNVPKSTLERWRRNVNKGGDALPGGEERGRPRALSEEQEGQFVGWVYWENVNNQIVQLQTCLDFLKEGFGVTMSASTVHEYLERNGFSSLKMKRKTAGYKLSVESLVKMAFEWLRKHWRLLTRG
jgi:transposase